MKLLLFLSIVFQFQSLSEANMKSDKNRIGTITIYSTSALFILSIITFIFSLISFLKNRKMRKFKLSEPQTHIYYKDKEKAPKLRRKVLEAMDKGGSVYKKKKSEISELSKTKSVNTESQSTLNLPASTERL